MYAEIYGQRIATIVTVNFLTLIQFKRTARTALELWKKEKLNHRKKLTATMQGQEEKLWQYMDIIGHQQRNSI